MEQAISNYIVKKFLKSTLSKNKTRMLFFAVVWGVYALTCVLRAKINLTGQLYPIIETIAEVILLFGIGFLIGFLMDAIKILQRIFKVKKMRYAYRFETCVDIKEICDKIIMTTDCGNEYFIKAKLPFGRKILIAGIDGWGEYMYVLTDKEYDLLQNQGTSVATQTEQLSVIEKSISVTKFLIQTFKIPNLYFVLSILIFMAGLYLMVSGVFVNDTVTRGLLRLSGGLIEVFGIVIYIYFFIEKMRSDDLVRSFQTGNFFYQVEGITTVMRILNFDKELTFLVKTDKEHQYELYSKAYVGDKLLIATIDRDERYVLLLRNKKVRYELTE